MEIINFIKNLDLDDPAKIRSLLFKKYISANYNPDDGRMILFTHASNRFNIKPYGMHTECNGLIINYKTKKPLVIPQLNYVSNINIKEVNHHLYNSRYDIYKVEDGTIINLYWWEPENKWVISTTRSFDLTDVVSNTMSYKEIISDILEKDNYKIDDFYNLLDKNKSYTFGFRHPNMHPFVGNSTHKIWFIQSVNLETYQIDNQFVNNININKQQMLCESGEYKEKIKDINIMFPLLKDAYKDFAEEKKINYGYILKSRIPCETKEYSNIFLESSLMKNLRVLYYSNNAYKMSKELNYDRNLFIITQTYLEKNNYIIFRTLFPQYNKIFDKLYTITEELSVEVLNYSTNNKIKLKYSEFTKKIYNKLLTSYIIKGSSIDIIHSYIKTMMWFHVHYNILVSQ